MRGGVIDRKGDWGTGHDRTDMGCDAEMGGNDAETRYNGTGAGDDDAETGDDGRDGRRRHTGTGGTGVCVDSGERRALTSGGERCVCVAGENVGIGWDAVIGRASILGWLSCVALQYGGACRWIRWHGCTRRRGSGLGGLGACV